MMWRSECTEEEPQVRGSLCCLHYTVLLLSIYTVSLLRLSIVIVVVSLLRVFLHLHRFLLYSCEMYAPLQYFCLRYT